MEVDGCTTWRRERRRSVLLFAGDGICDCSWNGCCCYSMVGIGGGTGDEGVTVFDDDKGGFIWTVGRRIERTAAVLFVPDGI